MYITRASRNVNTIACYSLVIVGSFDDLDALATLIASNVNPGHLPVALLEYPVGWRLQITSDDNYYPDHAHDLVEQRIREGVPVVIANGKQALTTYIYTAVNEPVAVIESDKLEDYPFYCRRRCESSQIGGTYKTSPARFLDDATGEAHQEDGQWSTPHGNDNRQQTEDIMSDAWNKHLEQVGLLALENLAQSVYYRVRVANDRQFDLEYTGGLLKYQQPDFRLKTFTDKQEARTYLLSVKQEVQALYGLSDEMPNMEEP